MKDGTTEENIREVFNEFGNIKEIKMPSDKGTGKAKGFAFIEFDDYDPVDKCVCKCLGSGVKSYSTL